MKILLLTVIFLIVRGPVFGQQADPKNRPGQALSSVSPVNDTALENHDKELLKASLLRYRLDSARGDYPSALLHYRRYDILKDSILGKTKARQIKELDIQYHTEKKDNEIKLKEQNIKLLKEQGQLQQNNLEQAKLTRKMTIGSVVLLSLLLGLSYNRYRLKQNANMLLQQQQTEINTKNTSLEILAGQKDGLLEEKEWLMKEMHHRVKNNLQIVISLLDTQAVYLNDDEAFAAIRESQHRMQSIALIHQKLYQSENRALINARTYMSELIDYLSNSFGTGKRIRFEKDIAALELDATRAVPIGLILNEAITNAIKYAFPSNMDGQISISLRDTGSNLFLLVIRDNGIGLPQDFNLEKCRSLGVNMMRGLCKQIGSTFKLENNKGVTISIEFTDEKIVRNEAADQQTTALQSSSYDEIT